MFTPRTIYFESRYYALLRSYRAHSDEGLGHAVPGREAESVLSRMMRDPCTATLLRRVYMEVSPSPGVVQHSNEEVLRWLSRAVASGSLTLLVRGSGAGGALSRQEAKPPPEEVLEARRVDTLLRELGDKDLLHAGDGYRIARVQSQHTLTNRASLEVIHERDAKRVLEEMSSAAHRAERQRQVLGELAALFEKYRNKPTLKLLVLKRERVHLLAEEPQRLTPSQLRRAREAHWIEVELVDDANKPVAGAQVVLVAPDGEERQLSSDEEGRVRWAPIAPGDVTIRLPGLDGDMWRPLGGAAAKASAQEAGYTTHVLTRGESLSRIARDHGLASWKKLWDDPKNEPLRKKRKNPHILRPGDQVMVPERTLREIVRAADATHRIRVAPPELSTFKVVLQDHNQLPFAEEDYEWRADTEPDAEPRKGTTDGAGTIIEKLPPNAQSVRASLPKRKLSWSFALSELSPVPEADEQEEGGEPSVAAVEATQNRLNALGFPCGAVDGVIGRRTRDALAVFRQQEQEPTQSPEQEPPVQVAQLELGELAKLFTV